MDKQTLLGPYRQIITMSDLPMSGPISDNALKIIENGGILIDNQRIGRILSSQDFEYFRKKTGSGNYFAVESDAVIIPGFIDSHTHICYAGDRAMDYARRVAGESYLDIARKGGGVLSSVHKTRSADQAHLEEMLFERASTHLMRGITTCEVKSGYGLNRDTEIKMLRSIQAVSENRPSGTAKINSSSPPVPDLIPTCLAAHVKPPEFSTHKAYLDYIKLEILPPVWDENLSRRVDIFIEKEAFPPDIALDFLQFCRKKGFTVTVHADQFSRSGSKVASEVKAISADHLEASENEDFMRLKSGGVIATVLPGATLGLGMPFARARSMLDHGLCLVIASDWNPGSAPMGDLLLQSALLGVSQKLTIAETLSAITFRAAQALKLTDRGEIREGMLADMVVFPVKDFREIFYYQGSLKPSSVVRRGQIYKTVHNAIKKESIN